VRGGEGDRGRVRHSEGSRLPVGEKFLNFLEAAENRRQLPSRDSGIRGRDQFDLGTLAVGPIPGNGTGDGAFDPSLFEPRSHSLLGEEEIEFDADEIEDIRKDDIRQCTRDLLLVERAREWLLGETA